MVLVGIFHLKPSFLPKNWVLFALKIQKTINTPCYSGNKSTKLMFNVNFQYFFLFPINQRCFLTHETRNRWKFFGIIFYLGKSFELICDFKPVFLGLIKCSYYSLWYIILWKIFRWLKCHQWSSCLVQVPLY